MYLTCSKKLTGSQFSPLCGTNKKLKYEIAPSGETTDRIKNVRGCKHGTDHLYYHAKYGGIVGRTLVVDEKVIFYILSVCFSVCHALKLQSS